MIVPTLRVGMQPGTLRVPVDVTQSVTGGIPTRERGNDQWRSEPTVFLRRTINRFQGFADQFIHLFPTGNQRRRHDHPP